MKSFAISLLVTIPLSAGAEETVITPAVESVGLFKNGLCVVRSSFTAPAPGVFRWEAPPRSVHGSFFVESAAPVTVQSTVRRDEEPVPIEAATGSLQTDLAGGTVTLTLTPQGNFPAEQVTGRVWTVPVPEPEPWTWNSQFGTDLDGAARIGFGSAPAAQAAPTTGNYLALECVLGPRSEGPHRRHYVALSTITRVEILTPPPGRTRTREKSVMLFTVANPGPVRLSYLTRGASWVPAYFVDLTDARTLKLQQSAVVKNELMALADVEMELISGFPNVAFGHVDSPLWAGASLAGFFQQLSARPGAGASVMLQNSVAYNRRAEPVALPDLPEAGGRSEDLHFESIGRRTLAGGDALSLEVAAGEAAYERVVEWTIPDTRDGSGQYSGRPDPQDDSASPWDAVVFQNPLAFPMTTASATIREGGRFRGQSQSSWTNPGQRSCLRITKALSVQTDHSEVEEAGRRELEIWIGGNRYYRATVRGEATLRNFRAAPVSLLVRAQFSGELSQADDQPRDTLRREGVVSVNARHELEWKFALAPGAEKKLAYTYSVLVRN